jgi:hypothetical protein
MGLGSFFTENLAVSWLGSGTDYRTEPTGLTDRHIFEPRFIREWAAQPFSKPWQVAMISVTRASGSVCSGLSSGKLA